MLDSGITTSSARIFNLPIIILVFVNYAQFRKTCRNYSSTFYFKFGENTSITVQQTIKWQNIYPIYV